MVSDSAVSKYARALFFVSVISLKKDVPSMHHTAPREHVSMTLHSAAPRLAASPSLHTLGKTTTPPGRGCTHSSLPFLYETAHEGSCAMAWSWPISVGCGAVGIASNPDFAKRNLGLRCPSIKSCVDAACATSPAAKTTISSFNRKRMDSSCLNLLRSSTRSDGHQDLDTYRTPTWERTYGSMTLWREYSAHGKGSMGCRVIALEIL